MRSRNKVDWDKRNFSGLALSSRIYFNKLERYATFLHLKLRWYDYEKLSDEEKEILASKSKPTEISFTDSGFTKVICGDCAFGCGAAPCSCTEDWSEYQRLKKEFAKVTLCEVLESMDENFFYRRVKN